MALGWESNFIALVPPDSRVNTIPFNAMKSRLKYLDEQDAQKAREAPGRKHALATKAPAQPTQSTPNPHY
jgi:hypothetical protein